MSVIVNIVQGLKWKWDVMNYSSYSVQCWFSS